MDEPRANAIKALEINYSDGRAVAKVNNWGNEVRPTDFYGLCEKGVEKKIGIPLPIQEVLARDLEEYYKLTGRPEPSVTA